MALQFVRPDFGNLEAYHPVKPLEVLADEIGLPVQQLVKLDANENLYGPIPEIQQAISTANFHIYPDPGQQRLRACLARFVGRPEAEIVAGAGSDDLLDILVRLTDAEVVVTATPTFGMYSFLGKLNKAAFDAVPRAGWPSFAVDVPTLLGRVAQHQAAGRRVLVFLASPNNPTGNLLPTGALLQLLAAPVLVVLDEAYIEFADQPSAMPLLAQHANLVVCRTFSKWAGLAGLRVGYCAAHPDLAARMMAIKQPYNVNAAADAAAQAAVQHADKVRQQVALMRAERERLIRELRTLAWLEPLPSDANFVLVRVLPTAPMPAARLATWLRQRGILIRFWSSPPLDVCIRVSAGRPADTDALLAALRTAASQQH